MKTQYHYRNFMQVNKLDRWLLPEPVIDMIAIFERIEARMPQSHGTDQQDLNALLNLLDNEIYDHLEREFFDYLSHNDILEYEPEPSKTRVLEEKIDTLYSKDLQQKINRAQLRELGIFIPSKTSIFRLGKYRFERKTPFSTAFSISKPS